MSGYDFTFLLRHHSHDANRHIEFIYDGISGYAKITAVVSIFGCRFDIFGRNAVCWRDRRKGCGLSLVRSE